MANFMFWNTHGNILLDEICAACRDYEIDVLILAEYHSGLRSLLLALNSNGGPVYFEQPYNFSDKLKFVLRLPADAMRSVHDDGGIAARLVRFPLGEEVLLFALHLPSKLHRSKEEQTIYSIRVSEVVRDCEKRVGHKKSIIIGDLNMDPFEDGVVAADGIHGVMDKAIALRLSRKVDGKSRHYFYNPMWSLMGDESFGPPGTYFRSGGQVSRFWHTFDQVLLRPDLLPYYSAKGVRVLTKVGNKSLIKNGRIDPSVSDHLPLVLSLSF